MHTHDPLSLRGALAVLALVPTLLANPVPQDPTPVQPSGAPRPSSAVTGLDWIPQGEYFDDPASGARIHPRGRRDLCVVVVNETVTEGSLVEIGRCLDDTLPYPGSRNLFNLTVPFPVLPLNETDTALTGDVTDYIATTTVTLSTRTVTVQYFTSPSPSPSPSTSTSGAGSPGPSSTVPLPAEIGVYEGLIAPEGQDEFCLSGDVFDLFASNDDDDDDDDGDDAPGGIPGVPTDLGRQRGPQDGLITLRRCNASDPAQWWRLGADVRVTVPGVEPGQGWKLSLRNQTQCASIMNKYAQSQEPDRLFQLYPCAAAADWQLLHIVNNGTTASEGGDEAARADADNTSSALGTIAAPGMGGIVGSLLVAAATAMMASAWV